MTKNEIKALRYEIFELTDQLADIEDDDEYNRLADHINGLIAQYHDARFERMLRRGEVSSREEYNALYGKFR